MFDALSEKLELAWRKLRGQDKITETNIQEALREVRRALLDADVNLQVVKQFIEDVRQAALGAEVILGVTPDQQFIKIVHDELVKVMGEANVPIAQAEQPPTIVLMVGLQGSGKTTTCAKLALYLRKQGKRPLLVAGDIYRPAAIDQLKTLGQQIQIPVFDLGKTDPVEIARQGVAAAREQGYDYVILDTAGRLQIDLEMMAELERIKAAVQPHEILLVVDAMIGQEAANLTQAFHERLGLTGTILTKLDGDTRGGAALSIRQVSGQPIKFVGVGEKVEALDPFYPDRMASRILGMGDILSLVEKAQEEIDLGDAARMAEKMMTAQFDFTDFLKQMRLIKRMGSLAGLLRLMPGMGKISEEQLQKGQDQLARAEAMINSMTPEERRNPDLLARSVSRKRRVALGSGHKLEDVSRLVSDFQRMRDMMRSMSLGGLAGMPGGRGPLPVGGPQWRGRSAAPPRQQPSRKPGKGGGKKGGGSRGFGSH
ncbi:signal recognition particle protein Srp54 [Synechococcus sp. 60AY4M2]|jgi:signal recognition particle subunit SRP54|uniref:signal recognition particle protein n=1 Tax=unclassified Synechococcus TaxID=2626047 RepID=UPI000C184417|nr:MULTISPECIES: signal recognition particle protein [unclassified Synechococcus]PIK88649.1 signal recognition particle protein Srp54 [Synechococcus sp. 65AY6A5]PIK94438.1 signal recognition particle protein Srp54 [Synechococcus sp. 60AY4M2]PIK96696.1 signal recognition particle protein Srp54 [Synechococcus sp. 63AY4M1]PIL00265.1 signal recognition particle protein Srp54 [Synechococcus sp. 65AY640]